MSDVSLADWLLERIAADEAAARAAMDQERPGTHWHWVMDHNDTPVAPGHLQAAQDDGESVSLRTVEEYPTRNGWSLPHFVVQSGEVHGGGGEHIARFNPARVLAECEAKRRIVAWHRLINGVDSWDHPVRGCGNCCACGTEGEYLIAGPCLTLRLLALPYADHESYREEWKP